MAAWQEEHHWQGERFYLTNQAGEQLGEGAVIFTEPPTYPVEDERRLAVYTTLYNGCSWVYVTLGIVLAAALFYRNKLQKPLAILNASAEKIMAQDLDFQIIYDGEDEMGKLCRSFEKMRQMLWQNNQQTWRQMEQRRRLNAAFAHDLRTPLTILKGYTDMLILSGDEPPKGLIQETAQTMATHVQRLEQYAKTMSELQRLEDRQPSVSVWAVAEMIESFRQSAQMICAPASCRLDFQAACFSTEVVVDREILQQVWENLLSNAVRYAHLTVAAAVREDDKFIYLVVADDGDGFSAKALQQAAEPYYTEDGAAGEHLGLGLYISQLFCTGHGGYLRLSNLPQGAQVEAAFAKDGRCDT